MGSDGGGIASLGVTLDEFWDPLEADFQDVYGTDIRVALWGDEDGNGREGCRRLLSLVTQLGPNTRFGRAQGFRDPMDLIHEWMLTNIQFQAGKKVRTPSFMREANGRPETNGKPKPVKSSAKEVAAFFNERIKS